jgi:hypothetical protein
MILGDENRIVEGGDLNQDYHKAEGAEEAEKKYPGR